MASTTGPEQERSQEQSPNPEATKAQTAEQAPAEAKPAAAADTATQPQPTPQQSAPAAAKPAQPEAALPTEEELSKAEKEAAATFLPPEIDEDAPTMDSGASFWAPNKNIDWSDYYGTRVALQYKKREDNRKMPGVGSGFLPLDEGTIGDFNKFRGQYFGSTAQDASDSQRLYDEKKKRDAELEAEGKEMSAEERKLYTPLESKLFSGYKIGKNVFSDGYTMGLLVNDGVRQQAVYDDGKNVRIATRGPFNAKSALAMATVFQGHRRYEKNPDGSLVIDKDSQPVKRKELTVNIETRGILNKATGGTAFSKSALEKRDLLIIANLHTANRSGTALNITGPGIDKDLQSFYDNHKDKDKAKLEHLVAKYNETLAELGERPLLESFQQLIDQQKQIRLNNKHGLDSDVALNDGGADAPAPSAEASPDDAPKGPGSGGAGEGAIDANATEEAANDDAAVAAAFDENKPDTGAPLPPLNDETAPALAAPQASEQAGGQTGEIEILLPEKKAPLAIEAGDASKGGITIEGEAIDITPKDNAQKSITHVANDGADDGANDGAKPATGTALTVIEASGAHKDQTVGDVPTADKDVVQAQIVQEKRLALPAPANADDALNRKAGNASGTTPGANIDPNDTTGSSHPTADADKPDTTTSPKRPKSSPGLG